MFKTGKAGMSKFFHRKKTDTCKEIGGKNDRKKLSFDIFIQIIIKILTKVYWRGYALA